MSSTLLLRSNRIFSIPFIFHTEMSHKDTFSQKAFDRVGRNKEGGGGGGWGWRGAECKDVIVK